MLPGTDYVPNQGYNWCSEILQIITRLLLKHDQHWPVVFDTNSIDARRLCLYAASYCAKICHASIISHLLASWHYTDNFLERIS